MELQHIAGPVHILPGVVNVGVVVAEDNQAILIDTGLGDRGGRQVMECLTARGLRPTAIFNTHGHGDHTGGDAYIVEQSGARVYAPTLDAVLLENPLWGVICTFAGGEPIQELTVPRYFPRPCAVDVRVSEGEYSVAGVVIRAVPLLGHTGAHFGYEVAGALFTGDALAGEQEMAQAKISYAYSFTKQLDSLRRLAEYDRAQRYDWYVLSHAAPRREIGALVAQNIARIEDLLQYITGLLTDRPAEAGDILSAVCRRFDLRLRHVRDYYLLYPTVHSCLSHLHNTGRIQYALEDNRLLWKAEP